MAESVIVSVQCMWCLGTGKSTVGWDRDTSGCSNCRGEGRVLKAVTAIEAAAMVEYGAIIEGRAISLGADDDS